MNTDKLTIEKTTLTVVHLAMKHKYQIPHEDWKELGRSDVRLRRRKSDVLNCLKALNLVERRGCILYFDPLISELVYPSQAILFDLPEGESKTESVCSIALPFADDFSSMNQMTRFPEDVEMMNGMIHCQGNPTLEEYVFNTC